MAKLKTDPIAQPDLIDFLDNQSDFSFEIQVLRALIGKGCWRQARAPRT
jgi:hypothetical protein